MFRQHTHPRNAHTQCLAPVMLLLPYLVGCGPASTRTLRGEDPTPLRVVSASSYLEAPGGIPMLREEPDELGHELLRCYDTAQADPSRDTDALHLRLVFATNSVAIEVQHTSDELSGHIISCATRTLERWEWDVPRSPLVSSVPLHMGPREDVTATPTLPPLEEDR